MFLSIGSMVAKTFIFEEISSVHTWMMLVISLGYTIFTIPIFIWVNSSVREERIKEVQLLYLEKI